MKYTKSEKYDSNFIKENMMGPNPLKMLEELFAFHRIAPNSTVLDLGCGRAITSAFMAKEYGLRVFATDLWIGATDNKRRFDSLGLTSEQIIPIHAEAHDLPYAEEFFDAVVCVDAYHYFGCDEEYLGKHLLPLVKPGGYLLFVVPGLKNDIHHNIPPEMLLSWTAEDIETLHDAAYWRKMLEMTDGIKIISVYEMDGFDEFWNDWLACDNEYAVGDRKSMEAGAGKYMNFISMIVQRQ